MLFKEFLIPFNYFVLFIYIYVTMNIEGDHLSRKFKINIE